MLTDDDRTPVEHLGPFDLMVLEARDLRDAVLIRAQQLSFQDDPERSDRCYRLALDVQIVLDAAKSYADDPPAPTAYQSDHEALTVLRERAKLLGVPT